MLWDEADDGGGGVLDFTTKLNQTQQSLGSLGEGTSLKVTGTFKNLSRVQDDEEDNFFAEFNVEDLDEEQPKPLPKRKPSTSICSDGTDPAAPGKEGGDATVSSGHAASHRHEVSTGCMASMAGNEGESQPQFSDEHAQSVSIHDRVAAVSESPHHPPIIPEELQDTSAKPEELEDTSAKSPVQHDELPGSCDPRISQPASSNVTPGPQPARSNAHEQEDRQDPEKQEAASPACVDDNAPMQEEPEGAHAYAQERVPGSLEEQSNENQALTTDKDDKPMEDKQAIVEASHIKTAGGQMSENSTAAGTCGDPVSSALDLQINPVASYTPQSPTSISAQARVGTGYPVIEHAGQDAEQQPYSQQFCKTTQDAARTKQQDHVECQGERGSQQDVCDKQADENLGSSGPAMVQASKHKQTAEKGSASCVAVGVLPGVTESAGSELEQPLNGKIVNTQEATIVMSAGAGQHEALFILPGEQSSSCLADPRASSPAQRRSSEPTYVERLSQGDSHANQDGTEQPRNIVFAISHLEAPPRKEQPSTSPASGTLEAGTLSPVAPTSSQVSTALVSNSDSIAALECLTIDAASKQQPAREVVPPMQVLEILPRQQPSLVQPSVPAFQAQDRQDPTAQLRNLQIGNASVLKPTQPQSPRQQAKQAAVNRTQPAAQLKPAALRSPAAVPGMPNRGSPTTRPITGLTVVPSHQRTTPASTSPPVFPFSARSNLTPRASPGNLASLSDGRHPRAANNVPVRGLLPQHTSRKPPLPPPQRAASGVKTYHDRQPGNQSVHSSILPQTLPQPRTFSQQQPGNQSLQSSILPQTLPQPKISSQQQPGTTPSPGCSHLAETPATQLTSLSPVLGERTSVGPLESTSKGPAPAAGAKRSSASQGSLSEPPGSNGGPLRSAQASVNTQTGSEESSQPSKRQRSAGHEGDADLSGAREENLARMASIQVPSRAAEAVDLAARLDKMLLEAESLFDHVLELKVQTAISSNRLIRLDNPIVNGKLASMHQQLIAVINDSEQ